MTSEEKKRIAEGLRRIPPEDLENLVDLMSERVGELVSQSFESVLSSRLERYRNTRGLTDDVNDLSSRIAREYQMSPSEVLLKALGLFKLALDANFKGNRIAILDQQDEIVQEIVGLEPSEAQLIGNR